MLLRVTNTNGLVQSEASSLRPNVIGIRDGCEPYCMQVLECSLPACSFLDCNNILVVVKVGYEPCGEPGVVQIVVLQVITFDLVFPHRWAPDHMLVDAIAGSVFFPVLDRRTNSKKENGS
jgi:hypothetical protein